MDRRQMLGMGVMGRGGNDNKIYGVSWDKGSSPTLTRTDSAVGLTANAGVDTTLVANDFDAVQIYREIRQVTDVAGNVFMRIPKFYIRKTDGVGYKTWQISKRKWDGFYLPWCFWDFTNSRELPYIDVGKYAGNVSAGKLCSVSGAAPTVGVNIVNFRTYAQANGAGYQQLDVHVMDVLTTLFYVEFATLNAQSIMQGWTAGQRSASHTAVVTEAGANRIVVTNAVAANYAVGQPMGIGTTKDNMTIAADRVITGISTYDASNKAVEFDGAAVTVTAGNVLINCAWRAGACDGVAAKSGSAGSNSTGKFPFIYRGIENTWGNTFEFVDGLNANERVPWVCKNAVQYASNLFASPYEQAGYTGGATDGYTTEMGWDANFPFLATPTVVGGGSGTYYADYYYKSTGQLIAFVGGSWSSGGGSGPSFWCLSNTSSYASIGVGARLIRKAG